MRVSADWNGDFAAVVDLPACYIDDAMDRPMSSFPAPQDTCFGKDTSDDLVRLGRDAVRRKAEKPRLVVLPMHVPSVMTTTETKKSPDGCQRAGTSLNHRENKNGQGADTYGNRRVKMDGGYSGANGGRSHCLRVTIVANPASTCGRAESVAFVKNPANGEDHKTEARFFERDLLRKEWTQMLVPIPLGDRSSLLDCPNLNHCEGSVRPGMCSSATNMWPQRRVPSKHQHGHHPETLPEVFVVLQARSAGFHPNKPPLWLVRRDFAERAVRRILSAAAAAVMQPRVEITLLGLCGAVDSLTMPESSEDRYGDRIALHQKGSSLSRKEPGLNDGQKEILCQAFWNGEIAHNVRLHHAHPRVGRSRLTAIQRDGAFCPSNRTMKLNSELRGASVGGNKDGYPGVSAPSLTAEAGGDNCDDEHITAKRIGAQTDDRDKSKDQDPTSWFSHGDLPHLDSWVNVGAPSPNETLPEEGEGERAPKHPCQGVYNTGDVQRRPGTSAKQHETDKKRKNSLPPPLVWTPAEGDTCSGRPMRLFFPACLFTNKRNSGGRGGETIGRNVTNHKITKCSSDGREIQGDPVTDDNNGVDGTVRGDLRLVFWLVSPSPSRNGVHAVGVGRTRSSSDSRGAEVSRKLLGCARLIDDELVLQPPGERVELALSESAGLDTPTEWAMSSNKLKR